MTAEPDYAVVRGMGYALNGRWYDRSQMVPHAVVDGKWVELQATGEFEVREDGVVAEVFRPVSRNG